MNIGLYVIGDEILSGRRRDKHVAAVIDILRNRQLSLSWVQMLGDDTAALTKAFRQTLQSTDLVFSTGGIGGTPDDLTRAAVAEAMGVDTVEHPVGLKLLGDVFDQELTPIRRRMVEFPRGAQLIPNPVNRIPGFSVDNHHFVPGFPEMAWPMIEWVLDHHYPQLEKETALEAGVRVLDAAESHLIPVMESLLQRYPDTKVFSLPSMAKDRRSVELGFKGPATQVQNALSELKTALSEQQLIWERLED